MIEKNQDGFKVLGGEYLVLESDRLDECIRYLKTKKIKGIHLNSSHGFKKRDWGLDFLGRIADNIEYFSTVDDRLDFSKLHVLHKLKVLGGMEPAKMSIIDLSQFPDLRNLSITWSKNIQGLEKCSKLEGLKLIGYSSPSKNLEDLPDFKNLQYLHLFLCPLIALNGISRYKKLTNFEIFRSPKMVSMDDVLGLKDSLEELEIDACKKITSLDFIGELRRLKKLNLSNLGEIKTVNFVSGLKHLATFTFLGTSVKDGDLGACIKINYVAFDDKKHYSHKMENMKSYADIQRRIKAAMNIVAQK